MPALKVLYLGAETGTCLDRAAALRRLGHEVMHVDPRGTLPRTVWVDRAIWRLGGHWFSPRVRAGLRSKLRRVRFDLCHVDGGELITPAVIDELRCHAPVIVNYNIDDPFGGRDGVRWAAYLRSVRHYDLCVVVRPENIVEARELGASEVLFVHMSADEVTHAPRALTAGERRLWRSEVLFVGSWFPERGPFLAELVRLGVPLTIRGPHWHRAPEWPALRAHWRGGYITGDDYAKAIQGAAINIGLLSLGNRDQHTTRSSEIPALGGLLCAKRTPEHLRMFREGIEAVFWDDAAECAAACHRLLADAALRRAMAVAGQTRVRSGGYLNEDIMRTIVEAATSRRLEAA
jgi:hypothetical protein